MRPRGEIRDALAAAFLVLVRERGLLVDGVAVDGVPVRDAAARALVGYGAALRAVDNMTRAGQLVRVSSQKLPGARHWSGLYAVATDVRLRAETPRCPDALTVLMIRQPDGGVFA